MWMKLVQRRIFSLILFFVLTQEARAVCYKHLQIAENDKATFLLHSGDARSTIYSNLLHYASSSFVPAEISDLAETFGFTSSFDSIRKWTVAAIDLRTKYKIENSEKVSFILEDAALVKNQMEALEIRLLEPIYYDSFSEPQEAETFVEPNRQHVSFAAMLELENRLRHSNLIPSLLSLWKQLEGPEKNLSLLAFADLLLLSNYYELLCPAVSHLNSHPPERSLRTMPYQELKKNLLEDTLTNQLTELGHPDLLSFNVSVPSSIARTVNQLKSALTRPFKLGSACWQTWKDLQDALDPEHGLADGLDFTISIKENDLALERQLGIQRLLLEDSFHRKTRLQCKSDASYYKKLLSGDLDRDFKREFSKLAHETRQRIK